MWLDPVALAWSSWAGLAIGVLGCVISTVGLGFTFVEARRAREAADQARSEVEHAIAMLRSRSRLAALSSAIPQIDLLLEKTEQGDTGSVFAALTPLRRSLLEIVGASSDDRLQLERLLEDLREADKLRSSNIDAKKRVDQLVERLSRVKDTLLQLEGKAKLEDVR